MPLASPYSPERRTALVLAGTGAHGAYHAGVLRALQEAGVKIDVVAGQGIGAGGAALAAIDGSARLWDEKGIWRKPAVRRLYRWTPSLRIAVWAGLQLNLLFLFLISLVTLAVAGTVVPAGLWVGVLAVVVGLLVSGIALVALERRHRPKRRAQGAWWWRYAGAPVDASSARELFASTIWELIRGAAPLPRPERSAVGRRYSDTLTENLGHPGFAELLLIATDLDARRDTVAALLREPYRAEFLAPRPDRERQSEVLDLTGVARDHAMDVMSAAMTPPLLCEPEAITFAADSYWRGETHRMCDRPGAIHRLLEETAAAGVTQAIVVSAVSSVPAPHRLRVPKIDVRGRLGEFQSGAEAAALRDALEMARLRFDSIYLISPAHNPIGPFDLAGAYDEASDRRQEIDELMQRGYEDAYRQFIEPVVGASGDHLGASAAASAAASVAAGKGATVPSFAGRDTVFDDPALPD